MLQNKIDVLIKCEQHANLDSFPLRFGFSFEPDYGFKGKKLTLFDLSDFAPILSLKTEDT